MCDGEPDGVAADAEGVADGEPETVELGLALWVRLGVPSLGDADAVCDGEADAVPEGLAEAVLDGEAEGLADLD